MHRLAAILLLLFALAPGGASAADAPELQVDAWGYPISWPDRLEIRDQLRRGEYDALEASLSGLQQAFESDFRHELRVAHAFGAFWHLDAAGAEAVATWAEQRPHSWVARLALAHHYISEGWNARGTDYAIRTSQKQFATMRSFFQRSDKLLGEALENNPKLAVAWELRLNMARHTSDDAMREHALRSALEIHPLLFLARKVHMAGAKRRWGGSYEELDRLAQEAQRYADQNPRLVLLLGVSAWDRGSDLFDQKKYARAIEVLNEGLEHGEHWSLLFARSWCWQKTGQSSLALEDLERALALKPQNDDVLRQRSHVHAMLGDWDRSNEDLALARRLDPHDGFSRRYLVLRRINELTADPAVQQAVGGVIVLLVVTSGVTGLVFLTRWVGRRVRSGAARAEAAASDSRRAEMHRVWLFYTFLIVLIHVGHYASSWSTLGGTELVCLVTTAIAFLGLVGYVQSWRIFNKHFWIAWACVFPVWNYIVLFVIEKVTLETWPNWGLVQAILLPTYGALFLYGYGSREIWGDPEAAPLVDRRDPVGPAQR